MNRTITLGPGLEFQSEIETACIGAHQMALAFSADHDPARGVSNTQALLTMDDHRMLRKALHVDGFSTEALLEFGPGLGDGTLALRWTSLPEPDAVIIHGHGHWNEVPLAAFAQRISLDGGAIARSLPLDLAYGSIFPVEADRAVAAVIADFARRVSLAARRAIGLGRVLSDHLDPRDVVSPLRAARGVVLESLPLGASALTWPTPRSPKRPRRSGTGAKRLSQPSAAASAAQAV